MWGEMLGGRSERHLITLLVLLHTEYLTEKDRQVRSTSVEVHPPATLCKPTLPDRLISNMPLHHSLKMHLEILSTLDLQPRNSLGFDLQL